MGAEWIAPVVVLAVVLPLLAALAIGVGYLLGGNHGEAGERGTSRLALSASGLSLLGLLGLDLQALLAGATPGQVVLGEWLVVGDYRLLLSFTLDPLGLAMGTLVALIAFLTLRFSVNYLHREAGFQRFFLVMLLFNTAMLLIVCAGSAWLMFVGWELAGVSSYLLIAYSFERPAAALNATRAFVTNRVGDAGFLLALFLAFYWFGSAEWPALLGGASGLESLAAGLLAGGFLVAALAKSAQLPFAPWIARALEGPTPSSAIFYGSLMVHAGVYLLIRLEPLFMQVPALSALLVLLGVLSALYGLLGAQVQSDIKSALMFATTAQVGLMFIACGLGWYELASWHLLAHASWRALQFLGAPSILQQVSQPPRPLPEWLRRRRGIYHAARERFWLENLSDGLLVRPTLQLAEEVERFDTRVVNRLIGRMESADTVSSLNEWERRQHGGGGTGGIGTGHGVAGHGMEWLASRLAWLEENLILRLGGEGLQGMIGRVGRQAQLLEQLLERPRYLWLMVMATFVVII
ncbi:MAG: proton-conducting transporter membrane subunit [Gammaproteobacteria bacterium]|nr:proton-conducting transporter membrane subunit [Gammaproteobacteria bacterium]